MSRQSRFMGFAITIALALAGHSASAAGGSGVVTIDGDRYEFEAVTCIARAEDQVMVSGPGRGPDDTPVFVDFTPVWLIVRVGTDDPHSPARTEYISDGESAGTGEGEPHRGLTVSNGRVEAELDFVEDLNRREAVGPGSFEARCE